MQGQGSGSVSSSNEVSKAVAADEAVLNREVSDDGQRSYEPPTQQFDKLGTVQSAATGAKSTTTG